MFIKSGRLKIMLPILAIVIAHCTIGVRFVGQYDEILDNSTTELQQYTNSYLSGLKRNVDSPEGSYENNKNFYADVAGMVGILITRSEISEEGTKKSTLTDMFNDLQLLYGDLENSHKRDLSLKIIGSMQGAFDRSFGAITRYLLCLKWHRKTS
ncbi:MAG TPA: hypothetical protein VF399_09905 [bacterium]